MHQGCTCRNRSGPRQLSARDWTGTDVREAQEAVLSPADRDRGHKPSAVLRSAVPLQSGSDTWYDSAPPVTARFVRESDRTAPNRPARPSADDSHQVAGTQARAEPLCTWRNPW